MTIPIPYQRLSVLKKKPGMESAAFRRHWRKVAAYPKSTATPASPNGIATGTRSTRTIAKLWKDADCVLPACRQMACYLKRWSIPPTRGLSACNIILN